MTRFNKKAYIEFLDTATILVNNQAIAFGFQGRPGYPGFDPANGSSQVDPQHRSKSFTCSWETLNFLYGMYQLVDRGLRVDVYDGMFDPSKSYKNQPRFSKSAVQLLLVSRMNIRRASILDQYGVTPEDLPAGPYREIDSIPELNRQLGEYHMCKLLLDLVPTLEPIGDRIATMVKES